ncbi:MAG: PHP domain-containing protein [archaeon]
MLKCDFHIHTGEDRFESIPYTAKQLISKAASLGYDVLSITNHQNVFYNREIASHANDKGILLIPGAEKTIEGKEVLIINTSQDEVNRIRTLKDLGKLPKRSLVIAPHPYYIKRKCLGGLLEKNIHLFHGIEYCHFHAGIINLNRKAEQVAKRNNLPLVGSSDSHNFRQFGTTYSLVDSKKDIESVIAAVKKGRIKVSSKPLSVAVFTRILIWSLVSPIIRQLRKIYK